MLQNPFSAFFMSGCIRGENQEIVHVNDKPSFSDEVTERVVHETLEGGRGVGETKEHDSGFEEAFVSVKCSFPLVAIFDPNIVVTPLNIELCEDVGPFEFVDEIGDEGEGIGVTDSVFIDISIVLTWSESSIFLFDEEEGGGL
jgi:hypothetical protein